MGKFSANPPKPFVRPCGLMKLVESVDDDDRKAIESYLANLKLSDGRLSRWFATLGEDISETNLNMHRRGKCCGGAGKVR